MTKISLFQKVQVMPWHPLLFALYPVLALIERCMKNLSAYSLPDNDEGLYPTITPVNTFRLILNKYFGQQYSLLEDHSLYSAYDVPCNYEEVPNDCQP